MYNYKDKTSLRNRQAIRDIATRYYTDILGYTQAIRLINGVVNSDPDTQALADKTIEDITIINNNDNNGN